MRKDYPGKCGRDHRREKRIWRGYVPETYRAFTWGEGDAYIGRPKRNPFPPGRRHDEYDRGFDLADPLGDWHGRNA